MSQLQALLLSLGLEVPAVLLLARLLGWPAARTRLFGVACAATLLTHPLAWHGLPALAPHLGWGARVLLVEGGVAVAEGLLYARLVPLGLWRGLLAGLAANAWSFGLGLLIFRLLRG